jgi:membrane glycosyltransferase
MSLAEHRLSVQIARPTWHGPRVAAVSLTVFLTLFIVLSFAVSIPAWTPAAVVALPLVTLTAVWISGGAATAILGLLVPAPGRIEAPAGWTPRSRTAILVALCKEEPEPLARYLEALRVGLDRTGLDLAADVFVLSDTHGAALIAGEERAFLPLRSAGVLRYRRRDHNTGRKPGNIADWVDRHGADFDHMLVLDADSRMAPVAHPDHDLADGAAPALGLLQAGIALLPGKNPLRPPSAGRRPPSVAGVRAGFAAWSGDSGNYWGHNAIMRVAAFRAARALPVLSGRAPWGGSVLSHDFVEAAWIRRAGWAVALDPSTAAARKKRRRPCGAFTPVTAAGARATCSICASWPSRGSTPSAVCIWPWAC